jgi:hypothetical protein
MTIHNSVLSSFSYTSHLFPFRKYNSDIAERLIFGHTGTRTQAVTRVGQTT